ncbi:MAG: precorrin-2 C(20)-methyltransferase [Maritimibacter sp.]
MTGTLIGVGLGPGDPDLMTRKAITSIQNAEVIAYPALPNTPSFARSIAGNDIPAGCDEIIIEVPMTPARAPAQAAYDIGAKRIAAALDADKNVVVLCEGDPLFYGSFMYLNARLAPRYDVEIIPGVTSVTAAAARARTPLSARNEVLTVIPGPLDDDAMFARIEEADSIAIMKVGRHLPRIRAVLDHLNLTERATYIERATLTQERILPLKDAPKSAPYFSMILVSKGADPWL